MLALLPACSSSSSDTVALSDLAMVERPTELAALLVPINLSDAEDQKPAASATPSDNSGFVLVLPGPDGTAAPGGSSSDRSSDELAFAWWEWAAQEPDATNPVVDTTGEHCARNQPGDVWFLAGTFGTAEQRQCAVPAGREIFFPVLNWMCDPVDGCETWFADAELSVVLDGQPVDPFEIATDAGRLETVEGNSVTGSGGWYEVAVGGWWVRLPSLAPGEHTLMFAGVASDGFALSVTYDLTVS